MPRCEDRFWHSARGTRAANGSRLYFFTTLVLPAGQGLKLYSYRWNIETDLRSLKREVRLHMPEARSADMVEKELLLGVAACNLTRAAMNEAGAARARSAPIQLLSGPVYAPRLPAFAHQRRKRTGPPTGHERNAPRLQPVKTPQAHAALLCARGLAAPLPVPQTQSRYHNPAA